MKDNKITGYELSRYFFDWCFENPEKIKPIHVALYFFAIEHCNRLGWRVKFGIPTEMAKDAIGVKSWHTYIAAFNDLVDWGFFNLIERSKNQYSSNIIALIKNDKALDKALDKAIAKHVSKHQQSTYQSIDSIDKQYNNITNKHIFNEFYDSEILKSKNNEEYIKFVKVLFGENNLKQPLTNVLKLKNQLTFAQFPLVMQKKKEYNCPITTVLENMENKPTLTKDYSSLQRTLLNWMKPKELRK